MTDDGYWIASAVPPEHRGKFRRWAERKGFIEKNDDIDLRRAAAYLRTHPNKRLEKEENLAETLRKLRAER